MFCAPVPYPVAAPVAPVPTPAAPITDSGKILKKTSDFSTRKQNAEKEDEERCCITLKKLITFRKFNLP